MSGRTDKHTGETIIENPEAQRNFAANENPHRRREISVHINEFDESNITWRSLEWLEDVSYFVYNVDRANGIVDVIFKFAANSRAKLHQHKAPYVTFVVQGELRLYRPDGELKEIRPVGSYVIGAANGEPHTEGGGEEEAIVFFSNRNVADAMYQFLDENGENAELLGIADFQAEYDAQVANGTTANVAGKDVRARAMAK
jgi:quercetin dioxygenase-like cupin family protein